MRMLIIISALFVACTIENRPPPGGGHPPDSGMPLESTQICTPNQQFCDGGRIASCTKTGRDAVVGYDCSIFGVSATNPYQCVTSGCPNGATACCQRAKPSCSWALTAPSASTGSHDSYRNDGPYCLTPSALPAASACPVTSYFQTGVTAAARTTTCPSTTTNVSLRIERPLAYAGQIFTLPDAKVVLSASGTYACSSWTGTVRWDREVPNWSVTVDATCSEAGKSSVKVQGTFAGDI